MAFLLLAALVFVWSRAKRFGPPDRVARELPPAACRVRASAVAHARAHTSIAPALLGPAQQATRERVAGRAALGTAPTAEEVASAARSLGCTDDEVAALFTPTTTDAQVLAFGRATARVTDGNRRPT